LLFSFEFVINRKKKKFRIIPQQISKNLEHAEEKAVGRLVESVCICLWWWCLYPTPSEGWGRGGTPRQSRIKVIRGFSRNEVRGPA